MTNTTTRVAITDQGEEKVELILTLIGKHTLVERTNEAVNEWDKKTTEVECQWIKQIKTLKCSKDGVGKKPKSLSCRKRDCQNM